MGTDDGLDDVLAEEVTTLRRFTRAFTPLVGVLDESFLHIGRPLAAARLLYEIGLAPVAVHTLRDRLDVDAGYLSRLLRSLERDALVEVHSDPDDRRRRIARLTIMGQSEWRVLDDRSDATAHALLARFAPDDRVRLNVALAEAERCVRRASVSFELVDPASAAALGALDRYYAELDDRFTDGFDASAPAAGTDDEMMRPPFGGFVVAAVAGEARGCGGLQHIDERTMEIKRMWLDPSLRGCGLGKDLLRRLERLAAELGASTVMLDTNSTLSEAISMYASAGYDVTERYNDNPYAHRWFRKELP